MIVVMVVTFFTSRVILQTLGETDYGIYNVVGGIVTMMSFINGALGASTSRFLTYNLGIGNLEALKKTFAATLNLHLLLAFLVIILGETIGLWFFYNKLNIPSERMNAAFWVYQFSIVTTCINFTQVPYNASIISHENMSIYAYVGLYEAISKLVIAYLIKISQTDRLILYAGFLMINTVLIQLFYRIYTHKKYQECRFKLFYDKGIYKQLLNYGGWDMFGGLAIVAQGQGINIILNIFFGTVINAARAIAVQIQSGVTSFVQNIMVAFRPQVIKNFSIGNYQEMYRLTFKAAKFSYISLLALTLPICFEIKFILDIWLGKNYPDSTAIFSILILITSQVETIHSAFLMSYHAIGKIKFGNSLNGTLMILALPISYIALKLGAPAEITLVVIFVINLLCQFISWIIIHKYVWYSYKSLLREVYLPCIIVSILAMVVPYVSTRFIQESWTRFFITFICGDIVLIVISWTTAFSKNEKQKIISLIKNKICTK